MRNTCKTSIRIAAALIICLWFTGTASADLLWNQPASSFYVVTDNTYSATWMADDFQLGAAASITQVSWSGGAGSPPVSLNGFNVRFYANYYDPALGHNRPADSPAYTQYFSIAEVTVTPVSAPLWYSYTANLSTSFNAAANTHYWFSVQADTTQTQSWWGWNQAVTQYLDPPDFNGLGYVHRPLNLPPFEGDDRNFSLTGSSVPLPGAVWLLGSGLLGLAGWRRLRKG